MFRAMSVYQGRDVSFTTHVDNDLENKKVNLPNGADTNAAQRPLVNTPTKMMQEILSLLSSTWNTTGTDPHEIDIPLQMLPHLEPLPFPSESDRIRELTQDEYTNLKRKLRTKLSSRRYARRHKDALKAQALQLSRHQAERTHLQLLDAMLTNEQQRSDSEQLRAELNTLMSETRSTAAHTLHLYEQAERMPRPQEMNRVQRCDPLVSVHPIHKDASEADQLHQAITNVHFLGSVLSDIHHVGSPEFSVSVYNGWHIVECRRRGSRFCVQASKTMTGVSRQALCDGVWRNADDPKKRLVLCASYTRFSVKTPKHNSPRVFFSEELHEFPSPFLCRSFTSIHGTHANGSESYYVKHSIHETAPKLDGHHGVEIVGVILQETSPNDGVHVALVMLYDTQSVSHAEEVFCEEPPVCHNVISLWEEHNTSTE